ncbi:hypothetical protein M569_13662 [Genlisea aurea]|uniref:Nuclear matrix constituent protein 1-like protein n=1 Tax=Genlisea aurea TaxID=192259 RepID=S8C9U3_9LAMI|nr:hypothetical protein M569_13662 [Genlisea aurea]
MFSPQRLWRGTPRSEIAPLKAGSVSALEVGPSNGEALGKGKAVVNFLDADETMEQESLAEKVSRLENELFEYQYSMGLLLIEKRGWTEKYEELTRELADATDALRREQAEHSTAISEVEKREENLKKALGVERQCVLDLEKSLREMRSECAEIKFNADSRLAEANAMITSVEEKSLEVEAKFHAADAKLAEVNRKASEIQLKLHEIAAQENALRRERSLFVTERETNDASISRQREDLREWEKKLHEAEDRLTDGRRMLNQREERANANDELLKERHNDLEELRNKIEVASLEVRNKEDDINSRIASLALKEKEADDVARKLEEKEKQLTELEDKLNAREEIELQKLLDDHKHSLDEKQKIFDVEMEILRKKHEEELKNKLAEVERKEAEVLHKEEKLSKLEQSTEKRLEKVREKENDFNSKSKALSDRENSLRAEAEKLEETKEQVATRKEELVRVEADLEKRKSDTEDLLLKLKEEREQLKLTEEERENHVRLQSELKREIDRYRSLNEQLSSEIDGLKQEKEKFEREWEELDDKRLEIKKEYDLFIEQKSQLEKQIQSQEENLKNEKQENRLHVERELSILELSKETFAATMKHEKAELAERLQSERSQLINDFEKRKHELEAELQRKQEDLESRFSEKVKLFEEQKESELNDINYLREVARREMEEMKLERVKIEKEQLEISENKDHLEARHGELKKDIEELIELSQKLKDQREHFSKERAHFTSFFDKLQACERCEESFREFTRPLAVPESIDSPALSKRAEDYLKESAQPEKGGVESSPPAVKSGSGIAGGTISWLRKCTKVFKLSPGTRLELDSAQDAAAGSSAKSLDAATDAPKQESEPSRQAMIDVEIHESDTEIKGAETDDALSIDHDGNSQNSGMAKGGGGRGRGSVSERARYVTDEIFGFTTNGNREDSVQTGSESLAAASDLIANKRRKRNRTGSQAASDSIKDHGDRPARRQKLEDPELTEQKRYNLRRHPKKSAVAVANGTTAAQGKKGKGKGKGKGTAAVHKTRSSGAATSEFSAGSPLNNAGTTQIDHVGGPASGNEILLSEEMNETAAAAAEGGMNNNSESRSYVENENDDVDEVDHPGNASVGKKIWKFLTT